MWKAIFNEKNKQKEIEAILEIIASILTVQSNNSLHTGNAGISLYFYYLYHYTNNRKYLVQANNFLSISLNSISKLDHNYTFSTGYSGILWSLLILSRYGFINVSSIIDYTKIDREIYNQIKKSISINIYDFMHGGLGGGLYFLQRLPDEFAFKALEEMIQDLSSKAEIIGNDVTWSCNFVKYNNSSSAEYNLGLSHGVPSIIYFLSKVYELGINSGICKDLLKKCINWLLDQELPKGSISRFPNFALSNSKFGYSRLAWCYGDLGIAISLWLAGNAINNLTWQKKAISIMLHASKRRSLEENYVKDSCLCHGTSGITHIFNRFYQWTSIPEFRESTIFWHNETIKLAHLDDHGLIYRFWNWDNIHTNSGYWEFKEGVLEGVSGIGLALLGSISNIEPQWDKCLLLS